MAAGAYRFERFRLDPGSRRLTRDDAPVELNARYFDALALMVREPGGLITKDRFMGEVWRGVPVTDEALTQCIRTLRKQLGDDAAAPRFIETEPKYGYRFIAPVTAEAAAGDRRAAEIWRPVVLTGVAGTVGGGAAGVVGGLVYGLGAASSGMGATSVLLVLVCLTVLVGLVGGAGVGVGIGLARFTPGHRWWWSIIGGGVGGLVVGAAGRLAGLDAFDLLLGRSPGDITGPGEGLLLGAAIGLAAGFIQLKGCSLIRALLGGGALGAVAGVAVPLLGGRLMAGSLDLLVRAMPDSRLSLGQIGRLFGEPGLGPISQMATGAFEGALFGAGVVAAMTLACERLGLNEKPSQAGAREG